MPPPPPPPPTPDAASWRATRGPAWTGDDVVVAVAQAGLGFLLSALGACLVLLARDLAVPRGELAWLSGGFGAALLALGVGGSWLLRVGVDRVLRAAAGLLAAGGVLLAVAPDLRSAGAGALLLGVGGAGLVLCTPALINGASAARRLTRVNAVASVAGITSPLLLSLADRLPGSGRLALVLPAPALVWVLLRRRGGRAVPGVGGDPPAPPASTATDGPAGAPARRPAGGLVGLGWLALTLSVATEFGFIVWGAARLQDAGLDTGTAAAVAAAFPVGMALGRVAAARVVEHRLALPVGAGVGAAGAVLAALPGGPLVVGLGLGLGGLGIAVLYPITLAALLATPGLPARRAAALATTASGVAILGGPNVLNAVAASSSLSIGFLVLAPVLGLVALAARLARRWAGPRTTSIRAARAS